MRQYCKAYHLQDLRQFSGWSEKPIEGEPELADETIVYIWDDFVVVTTPIQDKGAIFDQVTPEWQEFCKNTLAFEIPEDLRSAYQQTEAQESATSS